MCTKWFADGDVHKYFSPYPTPYDAFVAYMNVAQHLEQQAQPRAPHQPAWEPEEAARPPEMACVG